MNIKNYTSSVPVDRTILRIEQALSKAGASHIAKQYGLGGTVMALQFMVEHGGTKHVIQLPVNTKSVHEIMRKERPNSNAQKMMEQSQRTSWKLMQDWVEVQLSLIAMNQVDFLQVFLPYVWDGSKTYYQYLKDGQFKQLTDKQ